MSTNDQTPVESMTDDLDLFSADFFGQKTDAPEPASSEEDEKEEVENTDATNKDTHDDGADDTPAPDDEDGEDEDEEKDEKPEPKPKKNRFQERIDELTNARREAERKAAALEERLARLEQNEKTETPAPKAEANTGPTPEDKNEDGTDKYPLGEFDPQYIRDLTRHTLQQERDAIKARDQEEAAKTEMAQARQQLQTEWESKLGPAQERYPDFHEKGEALIATFDGIDQAYGEYLTATLMSMEFGPDVLYYLASNVDEAQKIVNSGPARASIALGRLEAKFAFAAEEKQKARPKVSQAPTPPAHVNKGSAVAVPETPADTDDLDAFADAFFKKKRGS